MSRNNNKQCYLFTLFAKNTAIYLRQQYKKALLLISIGLGNSHWNNSVAITMHMPRCLLSKMIGKLSYLIKMLSYYFGHILEHSVTYCLT